MTRFDYEAMKKLRESDPGFYALLMAAMMKADTSNAARLRIAFPGVWNELQARYDAPDGYLPGETIPTEGERR